jgi:uncharacterized coiled-coil protein SlyX
LGKENTGSEFLVAEKPVKKRTTVSIQAVGSAMATTLTNAALCVERVGALQQKLITLLSDMVDNGRKSAVGQQVSAERAQLRAQLRELSTRLASLNKALDHCMHVSLASKKNVA